MVPGTEILSQLKFYLSWNIGWAVVFGSGYFLVSIEWGTGHNSFACGARFIAKWFTKLCAHGVFGYLKTWTEAFLSMQSMDSPHCCSSLLSVKHSMFLSTIV